MEKKKKSLKCHNNLADVGECFSVESAKTFMHSMILFPHVSYFIVCVCVRQAEGSSETAFQKKKTTNKNQNLKNQRSAVTRRHEDLASCPAFENPWEHLLQETLFCPSAAVPLGFFCANFKNCCSTCSSTERFGCCVIFLFIFLGRCVRSVSDGNGFIKTLNYNSVWT